MGGRAGVGTCGTFPEIEIDPTSPNTALDAVGDLLADFRCPTFNAVKATPLAFYNCGRAVQVQVLADHAVVRPISPYLLAFDIVPHICRPVESSRAVHRRSCAFPLAFARAYLQSARIGWLPQLTVHERAWIPALLEGLALGWHLFFDTLVEVLASIEEQVTAGIEGTTV